MRSKAAARRQRHRWLTENQIADFAGKTRNGILALLTAIVSRQAHRSAAPPGRHLVADHMALIVKRKRMMESSAISTAELLSLSGTTAGDPAPFVTRRSVLSTSEDNP